MRRPRCLVWAQGSHRCQQPPRQSGWPSRHSLLPPGPQSSSPHLKAAPSLASPHTPALRERPPALGQRTEQSLQIQLLSCSCLPHLHPQLGRGAPPGPGFEVFCLLHLCIPTMQWGLMKYLLNDLKLAYLCCFIKNYLPINNWPHTHTHFLSVQWDASGWKETLMHIRRTEAPGPQAGKHAESPR